MEAEARFSHLKELAATMPDFGIAGAPNQAPEVLEWLGRLHALLDDRLFGTESISVKMSSDGLGSALHLGNVTTIKSALYRGISKVELLLPTSSRGSFIPAGNAFDAITATSRIISDAKSSILIIDPYLGPKALEIFAIQAN